jgi:hypothetical protein
MTLTVRYAMSNIIKIRVGPWKDGLKFDISGVGEDVPFLKLSAKLLECINNNQPIPMVPEKIAPLPGRV